MCPTHLKQRCTQYKYLFSINIYHILELCNRQWSHSVVWFWAQCSNEFSWNEIYVLYFLVGSFWYIKKENILKNPIKNITLLLFQTFKKTLSILWTVLQYWCNHLVLIRFASFWQMLQKQHLRRIYLDWLLSYVQMLQASSK